MIWKKAKGIRMNGAKGGNSKSFRASLKYALEKDADIKRPEIIGGNMTGQTVKELSSEFQDVRELRPEVEDPCVFYSLSAAEGERLSNEQWREFAEEFNKRMGYEDSPFAVIRHHDTDHEHVHVITSRINGRGELVDQSGDYRRGSEIAQELAAERGYQVVPLPHETPGREVSRIEAEQIREVVGRDEGGAPIYRGETFAEQVKAAGAGDVMKQAQSWDEARDGLSRLGLRMESYRGGVVIVDEEGRWKAKASSVHEGRGKLERQYGETYADFREREAARPTTELAGGERAAPGTGIDRGDGDVIPGRGNRGFDRGAGTAIGGTRGAERPDRGDTGPDRADSGVGGGEVRESGSRDLQPLGEADRERGAAGVGEFGRGPAASDAKATRGHDNDGREPSERGRADAQEPSRGRGTSEGLVRDGADDERSGADSKRVADPYRSADLGPARVAADSGPTERAGSRDRAPGGGGSEPGDAEVVDRVSASPAHDRIDRLMEQYRARQSAEKEVERIRGKLKEWKLTSQRERAASWVLDSRLERSYRDPSSAAAEIHRVEGKEGTQEAARRLRETPEQYGELTEGGAKDARRAALSLEYRARARVELPTNDERQAVQAQLKKAEGGLADLPDSRDLDRQFKSEWRSMTDGDRKKIIAQGSDVTDRAAALNLGVARGIER